MALEVVVLDKDEYKALIDNQADEDELEYLKACQYALESFNKVRGLCPKCKKSVIIDGFVLVVGMIQVVKKNYINMVINAFGHKNIIECL